MKKLFDCCEGKKGANNGDDDDKDEEAANPLTPSTDDLIAQILEEVGLSAQKDTPVGGMFRRGLSGGQKRRLSVALEALSSPMNLFLDEREYTNLLQIRSHSVGMSSRRLASHSSLSHIWS